jgi:pimeloyl-ACP methyl ester carboxylesterase
MYRRLPHLFACVLLIAGLAACGSGDDGSTGSETVTATTGEQATSEAQSSGERVSIPGAGEALVWGSGRNTVLLAHGAAFDAASWQQQAEEIAASGSFVVALEETGPDQILAASRYLREQRSAASVALVGASAGADSALDAVADDPDAFDQLITLSVNSTTGGLGSAPKLFIASEDEPGVGFSTELAASADGSRNEALLLPGSAHAQAIFDGDQAGPAMEAILERVQPGAG